MEDISREADFSCQRALLRQKTEELSYALAGKMTNENRFVLQRILFRIDFLESSVVSWNKRFSFGSSPIEDSGQLLQTIPGIDELSAALLIAEIGEM